MAGGRERQVSADLHRPRNKKWNFNHTVTNSPMNDQLLSLLEKAIGQSVAGLHRRAFTPPFLFASRPIFMRSTNPFPKNLKRILDVPENSIPRIPKDPLDLA